MDSFSSFFESQSTSHYSLKNFHPITPVVQTLLVQVYKILIHALTILYIGVYLHLRWNIGGLLTSIGCIGTFLWLLLNPQYPTHKKCLLFKAAVLFEGASIIPVIELAVEVDPILLITALPVLIVAPNCFTIAALFARRKEYLYLGGLLSSVVSILVVLEILSFNFGGPMRRKKKKIVTKLNWNTKFHHLFETLGKISHHQ